MSIYSPPPSTPNRGANLKVGDTVWVFDENRRVYQGTGLSSRIIYREHFRPVQIVGETSRSWIVGYDNSKINKKDLKGIYISEAEIDRACWVNENAPVIYRAFQSYQHRNYETLLAISKILGLDLPEVKEDE